MRVIYNGVDIERFRPDGQMRQSIRHDANVGTQFVWLAVGRLDKQKDYPTLLRAFSRLCRVRDRTLLWIVGEGPLREELHHLMRDLNLQHRVRFWGVRSDIPSLMNASDAFVMSSSWEGLPLALIEAQACGLPAVVTDVGGNAEIVVKEETGFIVPPKNPDALAEAMLRLMALPVEMRQQMGRLARQRAQENFCLERIISQWEDIYNELIRQRTKS
jgi:glycosyltransferase involved in cell wall biosynthesis